MNDKPFIKLLKSPLAWYFFDVNTQRTIQVDKKVYEYLDSLIHNTNFIHDPQVEIQVETLVNEGLLSSHRVKKIEHHETKWLKYHYERNLAKLTLQLTQNCNLRCSYCVYSNDAYNQRKHSGKRMSFKTAKKGVDYLLDHSIDMDIISISFYGGEPLLEFDLIKKIVSYVSTEAFGRNYTYNITTNGTLLNDEIIKFFIEKEVSVLISLDGPQKYHDQSRRFASSGKGSFACIINNIRKAIEKYPEFADIIKFNMVIDPQNDYDELHSLKYDAPDLGDVGVSSSLIDDTNSIEKTIVSSEFRVKSRYQIFLAFLSKFDRYDSEKLPSMASSHLSDYDNKAKGISNTKILPDMTAPSGPCIPGQMRLFVSSDGQFFPCERVSETSDDLNIGNINEGINCEKAESLLNIGKLTEKKCMNCWAITFCGICCKFVDDGTKLNKGIKVQHCPAQLSRASELLLNKIMVNEIQSRY